MRSQKEEIAFLRRRINELQCRIFSQSETRALNSKNKELQKRISELEQKLTETRALLD